MSLVGLASNIGGALETVTNVAAAVAGQDAGGFQKALDKAMGGAQNFMRGWRSESKIGKTLDVAKAALPGAFKDQLGRGLMGSQNAQAVSFGAALMGEGSPIKALKGLLGGMGGELSLTKLDKSALPQLGQLMADSGVDEEKISEILAQLNSLSGQSIPMDKVLMAVGKAADGLRVQGGGLIATEDGLPALGQFFMSLGLSPEVAKSVTQNFQAGDQITAASLRELIAGSGDSLMAPCLSDADVANLKSFLQSMGAGSNDLRSLGNLLTETRGQLSLEGFLSFVEGMEKNSTQSLSQDDLSGIKNIMANIQKEQALVKAPLFDEIMLKLSGLGDRQLDQNYNDLSPALQALRGGITGVKGEGGQMGQDGQRHGKGREGEGREERERYRQALSGLPGKGEGPAGAQGPDLAREFAGYGNQKETIAQQITQQMVYTARQGLHRLRMNLNPAELGQVDIELKVKDGQLTAHINAASRETYEALESEMDSLKDSLAAGGLSVANMTLSFDDASGRREFSDLGCGEARKNKGAKAGPGRAEESAPEHLTAADILGRQGLVDQLV